MKNLLIFEDFSQYKFADILIKTLRDMAYSNPNAHQEIIRLMRRHGGNSDILSSKDIFPRGLKASKMLANLGIEYEDPHSEGGNRKINLADYILSQIYSETYRSGGDPHGYMEELNKAANKRDTNSDNRYHTERIIMGGKNVEIGENNIILFTGGGKNIVFSRSEEGIEKIIGALYFTEKVNNNEIETEILKRIGFG